MGLECLAFTRKDGATGIDGQTANEYAEKLEENLQSLRDRFKSGAYRAPPVRRVHIPKGDGKQTRPIGIPTFEDKVLQRAVTMVLEAIYEQDFLDCSYGFRPGRSAHQALEAVRDATMPVGGGWVLEVDIRKFFDSLDHGDLLEIVRRRVRDGVLLRIIGKWLNAGVMEEGSVEHPEAGTPQGGVVSPLLANVYLHEVVDLWFRRDVLPRLKGRARLVRYADDMVLVFSRGDDARRIFEVLPKRFGKYGLSLHPEKTRLVDFRRKDRATRPAPRPSTSSASHTTGEPPCVARGSSSSERRRTASAARYAESGSGVVSTGTTRSGCSSKLSPRSCAGTTATSASRRTTARSALLPGNATCLAQVALTPLEHRVRRLGPLARLAGALPAPAAAHRAPSRHVANPCPDEPDAVVPHVRICGSPGRATSRGHPATFDPRTRFGAMLG